MIRRVALFVLCAVSARAQDDPYGDYAAALAEYRKALVRAKSDCFTRATRL
jgi:hypothetical protein